MKADASILVYRKYWLCGFTFNMKPCLHS